MSEATYELAPELAADDPERHVPCEMTVCGIRCTVGWELCVYVRDDDGRTLLVRGLCAAHAAYVDVMWPERVFSHAGSMVAGGYLVRIAREGQAVRQRCCPTPDIAGRYTAVVRALAPEAQVSTEPVAAAQQAVM